MGGGSFTPKLNYHVSCKRGGGYKKKRRSTTRRKYQDIQKQQEGQDPEEGRKEPRDN